MAKSVPFLMFEGRAREAMDLYVATFPDSRIVNSQHYVEGEPGPVGTIKAAVFKIRDRKFMCSDSPNHHNFTFTPASSIFIECDTSEQLNRIFGVLSEGGQVLMPLGNYGFSKRFGWVSDRFGVSWQLNLAD